MRFLTNCGGDSGSSRERTATPDGPVHVAAGTATHEGRKPPAKPPGVGVGRSFPTGATHGHDRRAGSSVQQQPIQTVACSPLTRPARARSRGATPGRGAHPRRRRISPDLYIPCGISGAIQHWAGCSSAKNILAINTDPDAPMVTKATHAVIGDLHEVVPAINAEIRRRRG